MLASAIRIREHGVRLLQAAELALAAACMVGVALLRQPPVGVPDLGPGSATGNAQDLVVVDLLRHRAAILTYEPASESPSCRSKEASRACSISNRHPLSTSSSSASPSAASARSEEHTSELQSRQYLVCRLLLEKKKNIIYSRKELTTTNHCEI